MIWFQLLLFIYLVISGFGVYKGYSEVVTKNNPHGKTWWINILGAFVWTDALVLGVFWSLASLGLLLYENVWFTGLVFCVFWLVRSFGEIVYWLNQQFSEKVMDKPKDLWPSAFLNGSVVWFVMQLTWQIGMVLFIIGSIFFAYKWLHSF